MNRIARGLAKCHKTTSLSPVRLGANALGMTGEKVRMSRRAQKIHRYVLALSVKISGI